MQDLSESASTWPWRLHLLGRAELARPEGDLVRLPTRHALLVLAALAVGPQRRWHRVELAQTVWPDRDRDRARASLRTALNCLRGILPVMAVEREGSFVWLAPGAIQCDVDDVRGLEGYVGEFMPGFDGPWVSDVRMRLRRAAGEDALRLAKNCWNGERREEALVYAEQACHIDPLNSQAVETRVRYLEALGMVGDALLVSASFKANRRRDTDATESQPSSGTGHPLVVAAEWVLARNPDEAVSMLASTQSQWLTVPLDRAVDIHRRVLAATKLKSSSRSIVEAQYLLLCVLAGRSNENMARLRSACAAAVAAGEGETAAILTSALAYAFLSSGEFSAALKYGRLHAHLADASRDYRRHIEGQATLATLEQHSGLPSQGFSRARSALVGAEEAGDTELVGMVGPINTAGYVYDGNVDAAQANLERCKRILESAGNERMRPWLLMGLVEVSEANGELEAAREAALRIRRMGIQVAGHSAVAMAEDKLTRINWRLQQYDLAAEAFVRAALVRRSQQAHPSVFERNDVKEVRAALKERIGAPALRQVYRRAALELRGGEGA